MYIIYTEIHEDGAVERWFYGRDHREEVANEVALNLGNRPEQGIWHCVCRADEAAALGILNMPRG